MPFTASDICKIIFAIILPPLGVFLERGCGADLLINICLTILGWIPGIIHAMYVIGPCGDPLCRLLLKRSPLTNPLPATLSSNTRIANPIDQPPLLRLLSRSCSERLSRDAT
ncbi:plasma membrane proteolipid 3, partial [Penicillium daleae]